MNPKTPTETSTLEDALYALSLEGESISAATLDEFVRRYPQYGTEITDFAVDAAIDVLRFGAKADDEASMAEDRDWSPAVQRAMSQLQNRLYAESHRSANTAASRDVLRPARSDDEH